MRKHTHVCLCTVCAGVHIRICIYMYMCTGICMFMCMLMENVYVCQYVSLLSDYKCIHTRRFCSYTHLAYICFLLWLQRKHRNIEHWLKYIPKLLHAYNHSESSTWWTSHGSLCVWVCVKLQSHHPVSEPVRCRQSKYLLPAWSPCISAGPPSSCSS